MVISEVTLSICSHLPSYHGKNFLNFVVLALHRCIQDNSKQIETTGLLCMPGLCVALIHRCHPGALKCVPDIPYSTDSAVPLASAPELFALRGQHMCRVELGVSKPRTALFLLQSSKSSAYCVGAER